MKLKDLIKLFDSVIEDSAKVAVLPKCNYSINVRNLEGDNVPHVHVVGKGKNANDIPVRLDKPDYFLHGQYNSKFSSKLKKLFIDTINQVVHIEGIGDITVYEWAVIKWNEHAKKKLEIKRDSKGNVIIPDYFKLETE